MDVDDGWERSEESFHSLLQKLGLVERRWLDSREQVEGVRQLMTPLFARSGASLAADSRASYLVSSQVLARWGRSAGTMLRSLSVTIMWTLIMF